MESTALPEADNGEMKSRPYQAMLEEIAVNKNTILHLPTGSGKTFIAIQLIKRLHQSLHEPWGKGGKRTFMLVNTVPLVFQHQKTIKNLCSLKVAGYSSEDGVDYWNKAKWDQELDNYQVIVMTCQILCDMLTHSYIRIEDMNLLIFDECHHAVDNHPMRLIMKQFENCPVEKQPRVLGLTATLLNANVSIGKVESTLRELETTYHAAIATVNELGEVLSFSTNPQESIQIHRTPNPTAAVLNATRRLQELQSLVLEVTLPKVPSHLRLKPGQQDISNDPKKIVRAVNNMIVAMITYMEELGPYGGSLGVLAYIILLERLKRKSCSKEEEKLYKFTITHLLEVRLIILQSMENESGFDKIVKYSSEKVLQLINIIKEYCPSVIDKPGVLLKVNKERNPLCGIIFVKQKFMAKVLYNLLKDVKESNPEEFGFLNHDFVVGFNINPLKSTREQHYIKKSSQKALLMFSNNELNCLISTSVIEEGVDIPKCLLVIRYDLPLEYRSYIQSKGRARNAQSNYIILLNENDRARFLGLYENFQRTENHIQDILVGNSHNRTLPSAEEIEESFYKDDVPPYVTASGVRLSAVSAVNLLNRYCSVLPHDQFTVITPMLVREKVFERGSLMEMVTVIMPLGCPIKEEIKGNPYPNLKDAKRSAALNTCIRLHQEGELDEVSLLPKRYAAIDFDDDEIQSCFPNRPKDVGVEGPEVPKCGTKKRIRSYKTMFPSCLNAVPDSRDFYLHVIKLKTNFAKPKESREIALYDLLQRGEGYGFLTQRALPKICQFPCFTTVGEVTSTVEVNYAVIKLNEGLFNLVKQFHFFIFDQILAVAKKFLVYEGLHNCMFVVPVTCNNNGYDINWTIMAQHQEIQPVAQPSCEERRSVHVTQETYQNSVVTPWYRGTILPQRYIVSNVLEYMTPRSLFGKESFGTYADYYSTKYNLEIYGSMEQPLLEVRHITSGMNCLLPRAATINSFTDKQQKMVSSAQGDDKPKGFAEVFVPEFCIKYDYPGVLWYKATLLPSIVHRVQMLLTAHELLMKIAQDTKYGQPVLSKNEEWHPLKLDPEVIKKSLLSQVEESPPVNTVDRINVSEVGWSSINKSKSSMKTCLYQLLKKKLDKEYPWENEMEPVDIERNFSTVTVMEIECYDEFMSTPLTIEYNADNVKAPERRPTLAHAIAPPPLKYKETIQLLLKRPTGRGPELCDMLAALTTMKSHDTMNLERVETLGDSFLKFAASLYLHHKFPKMNEGQLSNIKSQLISNKNLFYAAEKINLGGRMKVEQFTPRKDFLVPGFFAPVEVENLVKTKKIRPTFLIGMQFPLDVVLTGELSDEDKTLIAQRYASSDGVELEPLGHVQNAMQCYVHTQAVSDKWVADCVEAIIGTYLMNGGVLGAVKVVEWMKILPPQDNFAGFLNRPVPTVLTEKKATILDIDFLLNNMRPYVEKIINYTFKDPSLLLNALSHSSYIRNRLTGSYERLEFLGDAILDFLITSYIFENCTDMKPGDMTDLRSALVNNVTFAAYTVKLGLHKFICAELNPTLSKAILKFVEHQEERDHKIEYDVLYLINEEDCRIAEYIDVPKVLSDIFEAIAGAIYLDSGGNLQTVWSVIYKIMCVEIAAFSSCIPRQPTAVLHENMHACPVFEKSLIIDPDIPKIMVPVMFTKNDRKHTVYGVGRNKLQAKRAAAKLALKILSAY